MPFHSKKEPGKLLDSDSIQGEADSSAEPKIDYWLELDADPSVSPERLKNIFSLATSSSDLNFPHTRNRI